MTRNFHNILLLILSFLTIGAVSSCTEEPATTSGVISGKVTIGPDGNEPLRGVSVSVSPVGLTMATDYYGDYSFDNLEAGKYTLQFSRGGYVTATRTVTLKAGDNLGVDVVLFPVVSEPDIELVQSTLTFDKGVSEMTLGIRNTGTAATCEWSITGITVSWLSVTPRNGSTRKGSTSSVKVMVDRSVLPSSGITSTSFNVVGEGFSLPVHVEVTNATSGNQGEAKGEIKGRVIDSQSGVSISDATVFLSPGFTTATTDANGVFTYSDLTPGNYEIDVVATGYNVGSTSIAVNGGATSSVTIRLVKESSGDDPDPTPDPTPDPGEEDYSKAKITSCDYRVKAEIVSCKRYGSTVVFDYTLTNTGMNNLNDWRIYPPKSISLISGGTRSLVWTSDDKEYDYPTMTFRGKSTSGSNVISTFFPMNMPCSGSVTITDVSSSAKQFNLNLGVYAYPNSTFNMASSVISFLNVPIY